MMIAKTPSFVTIAVVLAVAARTKAFTVIPHSHQRFVALTKVDSAADEYLEKCMTEWNELEAEVNIVNDTQNMVSVHR